MHSYFKPVPFERVSFRSGFWAERQRKLKETTIFDQYDKIDRRRQFDAFRLRWERGVDPKPHFFWDSDVYKWLEAASYCLALGRDEQLDGMVDAVVDLVASAQQPDGYINLYYTMIEPDKKWTDLMDTHELYCAGHLMEAAVAHFRATGKRKLLETACRFADLIDAKLGPEPGKKRGYDGHQEVELALYKLYETTGDEKYLRLSRFFITERGARPLYYATEYENRGDVPEFADYRIQNKIKDWREYYQVHKPVWEQDEVVGHAVRVMYFCAGMADVARATGDERLWNVCKGLWQNLTTKRMYITGAAGNSHHNEGFTKDYDLPNDTGYCETCASIGFVFWNHRMLQNELDGAYADALERSLYNGALSGISLDGRSYFYMNPLASDGAYHRAPWQGCACCPPNVARLIGSLGQYVYGFDGRDIAVHLWADSEATVYRNGKAIRVTQSTHYPWDANVTIQLGMEESAAFSLKVRIPSWVEGTQATVNGSVVACDDLASGYLVLNRTWNDGDVVELRAAMPVRRVYAHPEIVGNVGRVALQRGPIVYCFEACDQPDAEPERLSISASAPLSSEFREDVLGGVALVKGKAYQIDREAWGGELYGAGRPVLRPYAFTAVPYFAWDNRAPGKMAVWLRETLD